MCFPFQTEFKIDNNATDFPEKEELSLPKAREIGFCLWRIMMCEQGSGDVRIPALTITMLLIALGRLTSPSYP